MNDNVPSRGKINKDDIIFIAGAAVCVGLLLYKSLFSVGFDDEGLWILNALRFVRGDRMLVDDWHVSQLSAFVLYPFVWVFVRLNGSAEGLILFSRIVYVLFKAIVGAAVYITLRSYGKNAVVTALLFLIHESVWTYFIVYYNTELLLFGECLTLLLFSCAKGGGTRLKAFFIGVFSALCVIACPYTVVLFAAYTVAAAIGAVKRKVKARETFGFSLLTVRGWLIVTAGVTCVALIFLVFLMRNNSLGDIVKNLPMVFYDDEYRDGVFSGLIELVHEVMYHLGHVAKVIPWWASLAGAVVFAAAVIDKGRMKRRLIYVSLMAAVCLFGTVHAYAAGRGAAGADGVALCRRYETLIFASFASICYLLTKDRDKRVFRCLFISGLMLTALRTMESDMFYSAGDIIAPIAITGATLMILRFIDEVREEAPSRALARGAVVFAVLIFAVQFCWRIDVLRSLHSFAEYEYGDNSVTEDRMSVKLTRGPMKGLYVVEEDAGSYNGTLEDLDLIRSSCSGPIMVPDEFCWIYMYLDDMPMGSYSGYIVSEKWVDFDSKKMRLYYDYHPERYPTAIYIPYYSRYFAQDDPSLGGLTEAVRSEYHGRFEKGRAGYIIYTVPDGE